MSSFFMKDYRMENKEDILDFARTLWGEARGETDAGMAAVACVIINRFENKKWYSGKTLGETAKLCVKGSKYHQFSCWNKDDPNRDKMLKLTYVELKRELDIIRTLLNDYQDITFGATHYHTKNLRPKWAAGKKPCAVIGNHLFYNNID